MLDKQVLECHLNNDFRTLITFFDEKYVPSEADANKSTEWYYNNLKGRATEDYLSCYAIINFTGDFRSSFYNIDEDIIINYSAIYSEMYVHLKNQFPKMMSVF